MDLPIEIFLSFIGFSIVMGIVGIWRKVPFLMFIAGGMICFWAVTTDNIAMGETVESSVNTILPTQIDYMNVITGTGFTKLSAGGVNNIFVGEDVVNSNSMLSGKRIDQVCISLSKTGSPTGTANIAVYDSVATPTSTNYVFLISTKDVTTFTTTQTTYCFTGAGTHLLTANQAVGVFYNGGSAGNEVNIYTNITGDQFDGTNSVRTQYVASWSDTTNRDIRGSISLNTIEEQIENTISDNLFPFTEYPKILFGLMGSMLMIAGALIWKYEET